MIRVQRRPEPPTLAAARAIRLAAAVAAYNASGAPSSAPSSALSDSLGGYDVKPVKQTLFESQHKKCAWCERRRDFSSSPIEHYRAKDGAWRNLPGEPKRVSPGHYWWLTWSWENLLFACPRCNDPGHKANYFPLVPGTSEAPVPPRPVSSDLPVELFDLTCEQPLLLDPAIDTFLDHVRWVPSNTHLARRLWTWSPDPLTDRGRATIAILKLAELADELQRYLVDHVLRGVEEIEQHLKGKRRLQAISSWNALLTLLEPDRDFTAATWCALTRWAEPTWFTELGFASIPRPS